MKRRALCYTCLFSLAFVSTAMEAEAERAKEAGETGLNARAVDAWKPLREEVFRAVANDAPALAVAKADHLLALTRESGSNADQLDALTIRGRVAPNAEERRSYYEQALRLGQGKAFSREFREYVSHLSLSHVQQDLGDVAMELNEKGEALRHYQAALDSLSAFDLQTYLSYNVSPDARYGATANELRYIVGWLNLREGKMAEAESAFRFAEKGMLLTEGKVQDSVRIGLAVAARFRGDHRAAAQMLKEVRGKSSGRGLASAERGSPGSDALLRRAQDYLRTGNTEALRW